MPARYVAPSGGARPSAAPGSAPAGQRGGAVTPAGASRAGSVGPQIRQPKPPSVPPPEKAPAFTVTTKSDDEELSLDTLVGDYVEKGENHGRKFYQKNKAIPGNAGVKVFLYYWDDRDGPDFSGWWFGDQIGGSQVWSRCASTAMTPPKQGWRIPWDAPRIVPGLLLVTPSSSAGAGGGTSQPGSATDAGGSGGAMTVAARLKKAAQQVEALEKSAATTIKLSQARMRAKPQGGMKDVEERLQQQLAQMTDLQKSLTQDIQEARKGGPSMLPTVTDFTKLSPRLRAVANDLNTELRSVRTTMKDPSRAAGQQPGSATQGEATTAELKKQETVDTKAFQALLPEVKKVCTAAMEEVEAVVQMAAPIVSDPPEDGMESLADIEQAADEAYNKISAARKEIQRKTTAARSYAPEARKAALDEFQGLQRQLSEGQTKLGFYRNFRKELQSRIEARKALSEISDRFNDAELEVEKASMMSEAAKHGQMAADEVDAAEDVVKAGRKLVDAAIKVVEGKLGKVGKTDTSMRDELAELKGRGEKAKKTLDSITKTLQQEKEGLNAQHMLAVAHEKVSNVDDAFSKCQDAEIPFLKGMELLPAEESTVAIRDSEKSAAAVEKLVASAKSFLKIKIAESKGGKDNGKAIIEELTQLQGRVEATAQKLARFKSDTAERKVNAVLGEVVEVISAAETKVDAFVKESQVFCCEELSEVTTEALQSAESGAAAAEKDAAEFARNAKEVFNATMNAAGKSMEVKVALQKWQTRLHRLQGDLNKSRRNFSLRERLIKGKAVLAEQEEVVASAIAEVEKAEQFGESVKGDSCTDEAIKELDEATVAAQEAVQKGCSEVDGKRKGAVPALSKSLQKLLEKCTKLRERIDAIKMTTKGPRERVMSEEYVKMAKELIVKMDSAVEKIGEAELPFLKGIERLPLQEANQTIEQSEIAADTLKKAITEVNSFIASKLRELKNFDERLAKSTSEALTKLKEKVSPAGKKLSQFRQETETRKVNAKLQEVEDKMASAEDEVSKLGEAIKPFDETGEAAPSEAEAASIVEKMAPMREAAQAKLLEAKTAMDAVHKLAQAQSTTKEGLQKLRNRANEATSELNKVKRKVGEREKVVSAKKTLQEAESRFEEMEAKMKKLTDFAAPLVEKGGDEFLVATSIQTLATVLVEHAKTRSMTTEELYSEIAGSGIGSRLSEVGFVTYLEKLPAAISKDEVTFTEMRRQEIFKRLDDNGDGEITFDNFKEMLRKRYICAKGISVTDAFDISKSKAVAKIEPGDIVEVVGETKSASSDGNGLVRVECRVVESGLQGWVTLKGNHGTSYLEAYTPWHAFTQSLQNHSDEAQNTVSKLHGFLGTRLTDLKGGPRDGPLAEVRDKLGKLKPNVEAAQTALESLKKKIMTSKREFSRKEQSEMNAHIEAREQKLADEVLGEVAGKIQEMEFAMKSFDDVVAPLKGAFDASEVEEPLSIVRKAEKLAGDVNDLAAQAKACLEAQQERVGKKSAGPLGTARQKLVKLLMKPTGATRTCKVTISALKKSCQSIAEAKSGQVSAALRDEIAKRSLAPADLFAEIATNGSDKIGEEAFCNFLCSLEGLSIKPEQAAIFHRHIGKEGDAGGIGKRQFLGLIQQYCRVSKEIAVTTVLEVSGGKTLRKAEKDELVEVLEGPRTDAKLGLERVKGRFLRDQTEGWVTVKGNQGTPFLEPTEKPFFVCAGEVALDSDFEIEGMEVLKTLRTGEVVELLSGPRQVKLSESVRIRTKIGDAAGWFTVKSSRGDVYAEPKKICVVKTQVALTDGQDIKNCKVLRRLAVDEKCRIVEGPIEEEGGVSRAKVKAVKDDLEAWVTLKGNAGTVYVEPSAKHYLVVKTGSLNKVNGEALRDVPEGEILEAVEKKTMPAPVEKRIKGRVVSDGSVGWITIDSKRVKPWSHFYKCLVPVPLRAACADGADVLQQVEKGETVELLDGPEFEGDALRMRCRTEKDGLSGWATIHDAEGTAYFEPK